VAIAVDADMRTSLWQRSVIEEVQASDVAEVVACVIAHEPTAPGRESTARAEKSGPSMRRWAWRLYQRLDARRVPSSADPDVMSDVSDLLGTLPRIEIVPSGDGAVEQSVLDRIAVAELDAVIDVSSDQVASTIGSTVRDGLWVFRTAEDDDAEFAMLSGRSTTTAVALVRRPDAVHAEEVLATSTFASDAGSVSRYRAQAYFGATHLVVAELRRLHTGARSGSHARASIPAQPAEAPDNTAVIRWIAPLVLRKAARRVSRTLGGHDEIQHWQIGYRVRRTSDVGSLDLGTFTWVESPKGHFYADPFLLERDGRTWLFVEDYSYSTGLGSIAVAEIDDRGHTSPFKVVITSNGHLSYPYVFESDGDVFMIPESAAEGEVRLYRAKSFPLEWEIIKVLHQGKAVDTSVVDHDGRWWFFTTLIEPRGHAAMMMLFGSETLTGTWTSHPMNPISRDVRNIRGAGLIRSIEGQLTRPSQDCSQSYGYAFSLQAVNVIDEHAYSERTLARVEPCSSLMMTATHTYNASAGWETVDGRFTRPGRAVR
jgi:hypothetical protein